MASVRVESELGASVDEVWKVVGDFGGFIEAIGMPVTVEGDGIGQTRTIGSGGQAMVERLEERDDDAKKVVYSLLEGGLPVQNYLSTIQLTAAGDDRTRIAWSSTFDPTGDESAAIGLLERVYQGGITGLKAKFGD